MEKLIAKKEDHIELLKVYIQIIKFNNLERNKRNKSKKRGFRGRFRRK